MTEMPPDRSKMTKMPPEKLLVISTSGYYLRQRHFDMTVDYGLAATYSVHNALGFTLVLLLLGLLCSQLVTGERAGRYCFCTLHPVSLALSITSFGMTALAVSMEKNSSPTGSIVTVRLVMLIIARTIVTVQDHRRKILRWHTRWYIRHF